MSVKCHKPTHAPQQNIPLFDDDIGSQQERLRNLETYGLRSLEIDDQFKLRRLLDRNISRLLALQDSLHELSAVPNRGGSICPK
jgi:hypothetical protein